MNQPSNTRCVNLKTNAPIVAVLLILISPITAALFAAKPQARVLTGHVMAEGGLPLSGAEVIIDQFGTRARTLTDRFGRFEFFDVREGMHELLVSRKGFMTARRPIGPDEQANAGTRIFLQPNDVPTERYVTSGRSSIDVSQFRENFSRDARDAYDRGTHDMHRGKTASAIDHMEQAVLLAPTYYDARLDLGVLFQNAGRFEEAEQQYMAAARLDLDLPQPLINLATIYLARDENESASEILLEASAMTPPPGDAFHNLGLAYYKLGRLDEAERALLRARELSDSGKILLLLTNVYLKSRQPEKVLEHLDTYLEENPEGEAREQVEQMRAKIRGWK